MKITILAAAFTLFALPAFAQTGSQVQPQDYNRGAGAHAGQGQFEHRGGPGIPTGAAGMQRGPVQGSQAQPQDYNRGAGASAGQGQFEHRSGAGMPTGTGGVQRPPISGSQGQSQDTNRGGGASAGPARK